MLIIFFHDEINAFIKIKENVLLAFIIYHHNMPFCLMGIVVILCESRDFRLIIVKLCSYIHALYAQTIYIQN